MSWPIRALYREEKSSEVLKSDQQMEISHRFRSFICSLTRRSHKRATRVCIGMLLRESPGTGKTDWSLQRGNAVNATLLS